MFTVAWIPQKLYVSEELKNVHGSAALLANKSARVVLRLHENRTRPHAGDLCLWIENQRKQTATRPSLASKILATEGARPRHVVGGLVRNGQARPLTATARYHQRRSSKVPGWATTTIVVIPEAKASGSQGTQSGASRLIHWYDGSTAIQSLKLPRPILWPSRLHLPLHHGVRVVGGAPLVHHVMGRHVTVNPNVASQILQVGPVLTQLPDVGCAPVAPGAVHAHQSICQLREVCQQQLQPQ